MVSDVAEKTGQISVPILSDDELQSIESFDDAFATMNEKFGPVDDGSQYGTGFIVVEKSELIRKEMILLSWRFNEGDRGEFVSVMAVTRDNQKVVFNDGSTGILAQLREITLQRGNAYAHGVEIIGNLHVRRGLRESRYSFTDDKGKSMEASTFYLNF